MTEGNSTPTTFTSQRADKLTADPCPFCREIPDALPAAPRTFAGQRFWNVLCHRW